MKRHILSLVLIFLLVQAPLSVIAQRSRAKAPAGRTATATKQTPPKTTTPGKSTEKISIPQISFEEKLLATIPIDYQEGDGQIFGREFTAYAVSFSRTGNKVAYIAKQDGKNFVVVGNQRGPDLPSPISVPRFDPDGTTVIYTADGGRYAWRRVHYYVNHRMVGDATTSINRYSEYEPVRCANSPDVKQIACSMTKGSEGNLVVVNDKPGPLFHFIRGTPAFSPNGEKVAYFASKSEKEGYIIVVNHQEGPDFDDVGDFIFSPDSSKYAYWAKQSGKAFCVVNEKRGSEFEAAELSDLRFSLDSRTIAYVVKRGGKKFVVLNDQKGPEFDDVLSIFLSPDGNLLVYSAKQNDVWFTFVNHEKAAFRSVAEPYFSPDNKSIAYKSELNGKQFVVFKGKPGPEFESVDFKEDRISKDWGKLAYTAKQGAKQLIVVGDQKVSEYDDVAFLSISEDGNTIAYSAKENGKWFVVINGTKGDQFEDIISLNLSKDGKSVVYIAKLGKESILVRNGQRIVLPEFESRRFSLDSPDSRSFAYIAKKNNKEFVVLNGLAGPEVDSVGGIYPPHLTFSSDSRKLGYGAQIGRELWWKVMEVK